MSQTGDSSQQTERRVSQYEILMRKFSEAHKEQCKTVSVDIPKLKRAAKQFPTGSQYEGSWDVLGMSGKGVYTFPNGVIYEGEFDDGVFHGDGELQYPGGEVLKGKFRRGRMVERTLMFADGLHYSDMDWMYCQMPDRRFTIEYDDSVKPAGQSYLTAEQPSRDIPPGFYDTGDGFYDPSTKVVYRSDDITAILRSPSIREQKWIVENCRMSPCDKIGPRPDLYEEWLEPDEEPGEMPLPASMSKATEHLFETSKSIVTMQDFDAKSRTSIADYSKWLQAQRLKSSGSIKGLSRSRTKLK